MCSQYYTFKWIHEKSWNTIQIYVIIFFKIVMLILYNNNVLSILKNEMKNIQTLTNNSDNDVDIN